MTADFEHSLDALRAIRGMDITAAFGPQHELRSDKQDNMIESPDFRDPVHGIPVFSLYGDVRRPTDEMLEHFDVLLVDLQDLGCRVYTFLTTLRYVLEAAARRGKSVWVLDRPNPVGRPVEGLTLRAGWESFVGAGARPARHGATPGDAGGRGPVEARPRRGGGETFVGAGALPMRHGLTLGEAGSWFVRNLGLDVDY